MTTTTDIVKELLEIDAVKARTELAWRAGTTTEARAAAEIVRLRDALSPFADEVAGYRPRESDAYTVLIPLGWLRAALSAREPNE